MAPVDLVAELLKSTADGGFAVDADQHIVAWNQAAEALLGFKADDVIGQPCYRILGGHGDGGCVICRRGCQPSTASQRGELVGSFDVQVRTVSGFPRWVNVGIIALGSEAQIDSKSRGVLVVHLVRDIEAKKKAEGFAVDVSAWVRQLNLKPARSQTIEEEVSLAPALTGREYEVLALLSQGASTEAIASQLVIGSATVRNHIQHILQKLGVHSRLEAVAYAREHRLLD